ncbi:RNA polymerase sigma factor [Chitinophaga caseinilytica]|uniref:RNA polymerase sigma factor n=1 Tax=Chitinophaga caseinilytica TaxID=2267521 RepID=UPI003C2CA420
MQRSPVHMAPSVMQEHRFLEVFRDQEARLFALALRMTKSAEFAQDLVQETFLKLWEHREQMPDIRNMDAWLYRVMENRLMDFLRKAAADERLRERIWTALAQEPPSPATITEAREYHALVSKAIDQLPPQRRLIYRLNREEGMSYLEIADELKISRHTVKNQLSSALQAIRAFLVKTTGPLSVLLTFFYFQ